MSAAPQRVTLDAVDVADPVIAAWWARIVRRQVCLRVERTMRGIREAEACSTSEAVRRTAERFSRGPRWVWRALGELQRPSRTK